MAFKKSLVTQADGEDVGSLHGPNQNGLGCSDFPACFGAENECCPLLSRLALCGGPKPHSPTGDIPGNHVPKGSFQRHSAGGDALHSELPGVWYWGGFLPAGRQQCTA